MVEEFNITLEKLGQDLPPRQLLDCLNKLLEISEKARDIPINADAFVSTLRIYLVHSARTMRTAGLRVIRYYLRQEIISAFPKYGIDFFIARSLEKDKTSEAERLQALKLIRKIIELDCQSISRVIIQSLISIAEHQEDSFCRVCLETLCEIAVMNPQVVAHCNGMKTIFHAIIDPSHERLQECLVTTILYLLDEEKTRCYLRPEDDIRIMLAPLTDTFAPDGVDKEKRWMTCRKAAVSLLKSWTGLICLASDPLGLKSIIEALSLPSVELRNIVLDLLFEFFRIQKVDYPTPGVADPFKEIMKSRRKEVFMTGDMVGLDIGSRSRGTRHNLLDNYISALLISFIDSGLIEALVELGNAIRIDEDGKESEKQVDKNIAIKATILLGELLYLSNTLLPTSQCARLQTLPTLVKHATSFSLDARLRSRASTMVANLHQYSHLKSTSSYYDFHLSLILTGANKWRRLKGRDRRLDRIDDVKLKMDVQMDDTTLQQKLKDTQVLLYKEHQKWNWEIISELVEGPLHNPQHVVTCLKSKFFKRLFSFLRPNNRHFSAFAWNTQNLKYIRVACQLLEVLMSCEEGIQFLQSNPLIPQIAELLKAESEINQSGKDSADRLFSKKNILKSMSREYFTLLGTLSSSQVGLDLMKGPKVFDSLIAIIDIQVREDLSNLIMTSLDYNIAGQSHVLLGKALTSSSRVVRYLATRHMRVLFRAGVADFSQWGIKFLVKQLVDSDSKVAMEALRVLDEACDDDECMETLIAQKPNLFPALGKPGKDLMLRFLSTTSGFKYLNECNFIHNEMKLWKKEEYINYVVALENSLSEAFSSVVWRQKTDQSDNTVFLPPHFYGELVKTTQGCEWLRKSGHFQDFVSCVKNPNANSLERRASLWVMGHVGASPRGLSFLLEEDVISNILEIAEKSPCLSLRGTSFYVLGMLSRTEKAKSLLDQVNWESPSDLNSSLCVPKDVRQSGFLTVPVYEYKGSWAHTCPDVIVPEFGDVRGEIVSFIANLSNHITAESSSRNLRRYRSKHPEHFTSPQLYFHVVKLLETYKFRLPARRFIYEAFSALTWNPSLLEEWDKEISKFSLHATTSLNFSSGGISVSQERS